MFSCGDDKQVKCWDLEYNKVVRHYYGHTLGVYAIALHPTLNLIATGGRDSIVRLLDMRTKIKCGLAATQMQLRLFLRRV